MITYKVLNKANKVLFNIDELVWLVEVKIKYMYN